MKTDATFVSPQEKKIKEVLASASGQRLLACMLVIQPITAEELRLFPNLCFRLFNSFSSKKHNFSDVAKQSTTNRKYSFPKFNYIFDNKELFGKNRILEKAMQSGLVKRIPANKGWRKNYYYFLNSDLVIEISHDGLRISENKTVIRKRFTHHILNNKTDKKTIVQETINFRRFFISDPSDKITNPLFTINQIFRSFWWLTKHPSLISKTIEVYDNAFRSADEKRKYTPIKLEDMPSPWRKNRYLLDKAKREQVIRIGNNNDVWLNPIFDNMIRNKFTLHFVPADAILNCFSNLDNHKEEFFGRKKKTSMQLLDILTSEDYTIHPWNRPIVFTSVLMYEVVDLDRYKLRVPALISQESYTKIIKSAKLKSIIHLARNTQLVENILLSPNGPMVPYLKNASEKTKAFSTEHPYILPFKYA